jgi:hypothetical protein
MPIFGTKMTFGPPKINPFFRLYVILGMNGQGIYATWTTVASLLNFGHALKYVGMMEMEQTCTVILGLLMAVLVLYFILENTLLDKYIRFLLTPYLGKKTQFLGNYFL